VFKGHKTNSTLDESSFCDALRWKPTRLRMGPLPGRRFKVDTPAMINYSIGKGNLFGGFIKLIFYAGHRFFCACARFAVNFRSYEEAFHEFSRDPKRFFVSVEVRVSVQLRIQILTS
jgi:hypothetical protein